MRTEVIPSARRLIGSLRDIGYDLPTAVADLIDNSIGAGARSIAVDLHFDGADSWLRIVDDGWGMTEGELREAMRFGTRRDYADDELGKFGLGLKAASLSQCRILTVGTRTMPSGRMRLARWDLDHIEDTDRWEILRPVPRDCCLVRDVLTGVGTAVLWEGLDRMGRYRIPEGKRARAEFQRLKDEIRGHLAMVFHRFIAAEGGQRAPLKITLCGESIAAWDPFARGEMATRRLPVQRLRFTHRGARRAVEVRAYVLPAEARFSSASAHRRAAGPGLWNRQQGLYIYRSGRLIQSGGWSRLRTSDEHTKLARISVDLPPGTDDLFELNVSKTQVRIPAVLRDGLGAIASSVARLAKDVYNEPAGDVSSAENSAEDSRVVAISSIVRMVLSATEQVVREELAHNELDRERVLRRLQRMEAKFSDDLARSSATPTDPSSTSAAPRVAQGGLG